MKQNKTNKLKEEEILKNPQYEPFVGNNYRNGIESKKGNLKILFLGDSNNYWAEYKEQNEGVSQGKSYCEYLMTETHENKINDLKKKILEGVNNKLKDIKDSVDVDDIAYYNLRIANEDDIPITNETLKKGNLKCYCNVLLKRIEELKPNVVFGEQNLVTQLKLRAVSKWKEIEQALNKKVKLKYESFPIIPISFKDNGLERANSNGHGLDKLNFIQSELSDCIDFLWGEHCLNPALKRRNKGKKFISIKITHEEYVNAYKRIHEIRNYIKRLGKELSYIQKNTNHKISSEYKMKDNIKQIRKMLFYLDHTDQYILITLVPSFMKFIYSEWNTSSWDEQNKEHYEKKLTAIFLQKQKKESEKGSKKEKKDRLAEARGFKTTLDNICKRLEEQEEQEDATTLGRMHRILLNAPLKKIYRKSEIEKNEEIIKRKGIKTPFKCFACTYIIELLKKMLTYLEDTNQYIYVDLVLQFMIFINKENKENSLAKKFLKKYNKEHNNEHDEEYDDGVKYLLRAIVERLKEEGDNVSLERMHWIFTSPKLKKIYKSEELDKLKIQIQSYNPN